MNKDEVLKMSREENEGRHDEREIIAFGTASRAGMLVGALVCVLLVFASELLFHIPEIGLVGWLVYFAMQTSLDKGTQRKTTENELPSLTQCTA